MFVGVYFRPEELLQDWVFGEENPLLFHLNGIFASLKEHVFENEHGNRFQPWLSPGNLHTFFSIIYRNTIDQIHR